MESAGSSGADAWSERPEPNGHEPGARTARGLLDHRFLAVTGKGGVGKTLISCALAHLAASDGRRVLVCDVDGSGDVARMMGTRGSYDPQPTRAGPSVMEMDTRRALQHFLTDVAGLRRLPRVPALARVFDFVSAAAPGVREVLVLGRLLWAVRESEADLVIMDGPASGHMVGHLGAPQAIRELVEGGMLADHTDWMIEVLGDGASGVVVVSTPAATPVAEAGETIDRLRDTTNVRLAAAILNRLADPVLTAAERRSLEGRAGSHPDLDLLLAHERARSDALAHAAAFRDLASDAVRATMPALEGRADDMVVLAADALGSEL